MPQEPDIEELYEFVYGEQPPELREPLSEPPAWSPALTPPQQKAFGDPTPNTLLAGEKACISTDSMVYTGDGLIRLGRLPTELPLPGFSPLAKPVWSFNCATQKAVAAKTKAYWNEPSRDGVWFNFEHGSELTTSPIHPLWVCWQSPSDEHGFSYEKAEDIARQLKDGWRYWVPMMGHPNWNRKQLHQFHVVQRPQVCRVCGKPSAARGLCRSHYQNLVRYHDETHNLKDNITVPLTKDLAYAIGALIGDGSMNRSDTTERSVTFTNIDLECIDAVDAGLRQIGARLSKSHARKMSHIVSPPETIRQLIRQMDIGCLSYFKRIPNQIIESPKPVVAAFLSGLFDTDGTVDKAGNVQFCTTSEDLSLDVQNILMAFGLLCIRRPKKSASGRMTWTLSLHGQFAHKFGKEIGFKITRKQSRIKQPTISFKRPEGFNRNRYGFPSPIRATLKRIALDARDGTRDRAWHDKHRRLHSFGSIPQRAKVDKFCALYNCRDQLTPFLVSDIWSEIVSASPTSLARLADLNVPGHHSFLANGLVHHNSGKSVCACHKLVRHCYEAGDPRRLEPVTALALIIVRTYGAGDFGVWYDLEQLVLPAWRDGNRQPAWLYTGPPEGDRRNPDNWKENPHAFELMDGGIGLEYTATKHDVKTKASKIFIRNRFGSWSLVVMLSIPYAIQIIDRVKGPSPSFVYVEELTDTENQQYHSYPSAQLDRRRGTGITPHQYVASCNPAGPSHWVYKLWFEQNQCDDEEKRNPEFAYHHLPFIDNIPFVGPKYLTRLSSAFKHDPIEVARLIDGVWQDRPAGQPIFAGDWATAVHVKPAPGTQAHRNGLGLTPTFGFTILVGHDPGPVNYSVTFLQLITIAGQKLVAKVFDELNFVGKYMPYARVVNAVMRRMLFWAEYLNKLRPPQLITSATQLPNSVTAIPFEHIADAAAFNQLTNEGRFENVIIEDLSRNWHEQQAALKTPNINLITPIRMFPAPKGDDSVPARTQMVKHLLQTEALAVSARCTKLIEMFSLLESEDPRERKYDPNHAFRPKSGIYKHAFDSLTYPLFKYLSHGFTNVLRTQQLPAPRVYEMR